MWHGFQTHDSKIGLASALSYWCFLCRDKDKSPAMGIKTWEYFQSSLSNAVIPSGSVSDFIENFSKKLVVNHLNPSVFSRILNPQQKILRINNKDEIVELKQDQENVKLQWMGWEEILHSLRMQGVTDRHILKQIKDCPHLIAALVRLRHEEEKELKLTEEEENNV
jgi:hypothetical protein